MSRRGLEPGDGPMKAYLITSHSQYYPCGGAIDWDSLHIDEAEAQAAYASLNNGDYKYLIELRLDRDGSTWRVLETAGI